MANTKRLRKTGRRVTEADARIVQAVAPRSGSALGKVVALIGKLGDQPELRTLSGMVIAGGLVTSNRRLAGTGVRMLLAHELATLGKDLVKKRFDRTRPHSANSHRQRAVKPGRSTAKTETSFPSGHSAGSVAVARAFSRQYPQHRVPALAAAALVSGVQVPRLNHYPTDVAAGMLLGVISEAAANLLFGDPREMPKREARRPFPPPA